MTIDGWDKLKGLTYRGYCVVGTHKVDECYIIEMINYSTQRLDLTMHLEKKENEVYSLTAIDLERVKRFQYLLSKDSIDEYDKFVLLYQQMIDNLCIEKYIK